MPFEYTIDPERNLMRETVTGTVTLEGLKEFATRQVRDPLYRRGMRVVSDYRQAHADITFEEMLEFVRLLSGHVYHVRQAIVVTRQLEFAVARMFEQLSEGDADRWGKYRVFRDIAAAEAWAMGDDDSEAA
jgi:hypothetical protein